MAILKVARMGHPVLRQISEPVSAAEIRSDAFQTFCDDLLETMEEYDGAGLAAPQVHVLKRVVVLTLTDERGPEFLVNPEIVPASDVTERTWEGCLSVPGLRGLVERPGHIIVRALDRDGSKKAFELNGFPAVVVQHECDHLDGVLYVDRALPRSLTFVEEYRRYGPPPGYEDEDAFEDEEEG